MCDGVLSLAGLGQVLDSVLSLAGLGQVLEFMYTAKLNLSPENVDDVMAVASFLQMQDIVTACQTLKSLAEPTSTAGESADASAVEGEVIGQPFLRCGFWSLCLTVGYLTGSQIPRLPCLRCGDAGKVCLALLERVLMPAPFYLWAAEGRSHTWATRCPELLSEPLRAALPEALLVTSQKPVDS